MDHNHNLTFLGSYYSPSGHKSEVSDSVVIDSTEVNSGFGAFSDPHVPSSDTSISSPVDQGCPRRSRFLGSLGSL